MISIGMVSASSDLDIKDESISESTDTIVDSNLEESSIDIEGTDGSSIDIEGINEDLEDESALSPIEDNSQKTEKNVLTDDESETGDSTSKDGINGVISANISSTTYNKYSEDLVINITVPEEYYSTDDGENCYGRVSVEFDDEFIAFLVEDEGITYSQTHYVLVDQLSSINLTKLTDLDNKVFRDGTLYISYQAPYKEGEGFEIRYDALSFNMIVNDPYIDYEANGENGIIYVDLPSTTFDLEEDEPFLVNYQLPKNANGTLEIYTSSFFETFAINSNNITGSIDISEFLSELKPGKYYLNFGYNDANYDDYICFDITVVGDASEFDKKDTVLKVYDVRSYVGVNPTLKALLKDEDGNLVSGKRICFEVQNKKYYATTNILGIAIVKIDKLAAGSYAIYASFDGDDDYLDDDSEAKLTVKKISANIIPTALTTTYKSGKTFKIKVLSASKAVVSLKLTLKVYTGTNYKTYSVTTNKYGIATFKASSLAVGIHKVIVSFSNAKYQATAKSSQIKIKKAKTIVKAPKITAKYKKAKYFKVTIKNKATKKVVPKIKVKITVYTGKKSKTYTVKTNAKGIAKISTKKLKKGTHKVVIKSGNKNYTISKKSSIKIK